MIADFAEFNHRTFRRADVVREFSTWDWIEPGEELLIERVENEIVDRGILEIGVGAGRLVKRLRQISRNYIGIDYSREMVEVCRKRFPGVVFFCSDARDLSQIQNESIALVVFSFNGIDYVSHDDRVRVMDEVWRLLAKHGYFLFSSHNIESTIYPQQDMTRDLPDHSVVREDMKNMVYFCYYAKESAVRHQLRTAGFRDKVECCDRDGLAPGTNQRSGWLHYLAQK